MAALWLERRAWDSSLLTCLGTSGVTEAHPRLLWGLLTYPAAVSCGQVLFSCLGICTASTFLTVPAHFLGWFLAFHLVLKGR